MRFAIGDSHSVFFGQSKLMECHWLGCIGVATIYQLINKGLDLFELQRQIIDSQHCKENGYMGWQSSNGEYLPPNIKKGDEVIFCYGFNDIQKNIHKYTPVNPEESIRYWLRRYIVTLFDYQIVYQIKCIALSIPPCPLPSPIEGKYNNGIFGDFQSYGTDKERIEYTEFGNLILKDLCNEFNISFLDIHYNISRDGFIKKEFTTDYVHLQYDNKELIEGIKLSLQNI